MRYVEQIMIGCLVLAATAAIGQMNSSPQQPETQPAAHKAQPAITDRGQQVFNQNCTRCHSTPEGFPPSISRSIATHMRVRAGLSEPDFKALLRFLNP